MTGKISMTWKEILSVSPLIPLSAGDGHGSYGFMDEEILMGRNAWLDGDPFAKEEEPGMPGLDD